MDHDTLSLENPSESHVDTNSSLYPTSLVLISPQSHQLPQSDRIIIIRSKTRNSKPKAYPVFKIFYATNHPFSCFTNILTEFEPTYHTQAIAKHE